MQKTQFLNLIPYLICLILGLFIMKSCDERAQLRNELNSYKQDNKELVNHINQVKEDNQILMVEVSNFENQIDSLETEIKKAKTKKTKLVETIKYVEVKNDTIENLNALNDHIIRDFEKLVEIKDSIILRQNVVIQNDDELIDHLKREMDERNARLVEMNKELRREKRKKNFWQITTGVAGVTIIALAI